MTTDHSSRRPSFRGESIQDAEDLARFPDENPNPVMRISTDYRLVYANRRCGAVLERLKLRVGDQVTEDLRYAVDDARASGDPQRVVVSSNRVVYGLTLYPVRGRDYLNVFGRDITHERQAESRADDMSRFPDENPHPVMRISDELVVLYANGPSRPILAAWGVDVGGAMPEELRPKIRSGFSAERNVYIEVTFGDSIYALQVAPVKGASYANVYGRDITRLRRAEEDLLEANAILEEQNEELAQKNNALQRADRLKDEFLANTSHELRTPLNGIVGLAEALLDGVTGPLPDATREHLSLIESSGRRLARLVNDILDFSRLQQANLDLSKRAIDVKTAVDVVVMLSKPMIRNKKLTLRSEVPSGLPLALADEDRLQQILHNLLGNSIKFTAEGEVVISAAVEGTGGQQVLAITVSDTGIGIDESKLQSIFGAFEQGDGSTAREYGGTGLGLSVTQALVELHGGTIKAESVLGEGSRFTFTLPVASAADLAERGRGDGANAAALLNRLGREPTPDDMSEAPTAGNTMTESEAKAAVEMLVSLDDRVDVLVVDDDPVNLCVLESHLSPRGYTVHTAESGAAALQLVENGLRPDIVLLDVMMPHMSGYEVCRELRQRFAPHELPVVLVTARTQVGDLVDGLSSGANDYVTKPISKRELLARLKTHLINARMSTAAGRFVPREFLKILGHDTLVDVSRGDHLEKDMSILFSDIRSFTTIVEGKTPQQNFAFINEYLGYMESPIRKNNGFIDSYEGDAIMALFEGRAEDAVNAGIGDQMALQELNAHRAERGEIPVCIGLGVNSGHLMLGTIGGEDRIKCGVIGDPVNLAARIESMTKFYGAGFLISEFTRDRLVDPDACELRLMDRVVVKGKTRPVTVYEVLDGLPEAERDAKLESRDDFARAWKLFRAGEMADALRGFDDAARRAPDDIAVKLYQDRCRLYLENGVPSDWDGVVRLEKK
jgi:two-component system sensor histidine kinase ChiS